MRREHRADRAGRVTAEQLLRAVGPGRAILSWMPSSWLLLMIGPITVSDSRGSPAFSPRARST